MSRKDKKGRVLKQGESERSDGSYQYRYQDTLGKQHYIYAKTLDDLRKKIAQIDFTAALPAQKFSMLKISDICTNWLAIYQGLVKQTTYASYYWCYQTYIAQYIGHKPLNDVTHTYLITFFKNLRYNQNISPNILKKVFNILNSSFDFAVIEQTVQTNILTDIRMPLKKILDETDYLSFPLDEISQNRLSRPQAESLLSYLNSKRNKMQYNRIATLLYTGMRVSELCGLLWEDIDFTNNRIYIRHNLVYYRGIDGYSTVMNTPKSKTSRRIIPMHPRLKDILICMKAEQDTQIDFEVYKGLVFTTTQKNHLKAQVVADNLKNILKKYNQAQTDPKLKITQCTPHTLRHTFCSILYENGADVKVISKILGHNSIDITLGIYTNIAPDKEISDLQKLPILG